MLQSALVSSFKNNFIKDYNCSCVANAPAYDDAIEKLQSVRFMDRIIDECWCCLYPSCDRGVNGS